MAASMLDKYGLKEVCDVTFYKIKDNGTAGEPVLFLDTLKVSTVEQTAENTSARGGKGNSELVIWDYNKEINFTLEDALFSMKSMALMFGDVDYASEQTTITRTFDVSKEQAAPQNFELGNGKKVAATGAKYYDEKGALTGESNDGTFVAGKSKYAVLDITVDGLEIEISPNSFPGNYYITGETYIRSNTTGEDELFQLVIPKAKLLSEVTLTMEAEGDPSTFNMNMRALRPETGPIMKLIKYDIAD